MQRTVASFALATFSLLVSYAIVAIWPDRMGPSQTVVAIIAPVEGGPVAAQAPPTIIGLAN
jgi:predicted membrane protein